MCRSKRLIGGRLAGVLGGLVLTLGCLPTLLIGGGAVVGAGTVAYAKGELHSSENAQLTRTWTAARATMRDLGFSVVSSEEDVRYSRLVALTDDDRRVQIVLEAPSREITEIHIRVGFFGDVTLSHLILDRIRAKL